MKTCKSLLFTTLLVTAGSTVTAQPILNQSNAGPVAGDSYAIVTCGDANTFAPGSAGANVTWNYGQICTTPANDMVTFRALTTSEATDFPGATIACDYLSTSSISYWKVNATEYGLIGVASALGDVVHDDSRVLVPFPAQMGTTLADPFGGTANTIPRRGAVNIQVDGYGTLTTPAGTYTNAVRVKSIAAYGDTMDVFGSPFPVGYYYDTTYHWYAAGIHTPVLTFTALNITSFGISTGITRSLSYTDATVGINPAVSNPLFMAHYQEDARQLLVWFSHKAFTGRVVMLDMAGREVAAVNVATDAACTFEGLNLPSGTYAIQATDATGTAGSMKVIIP